MVFCLIIKQGRWVGVSTSCRIVRYGKIEITSTVSPAGAARPVDPSPSSLLISSNSAPWVTGSPDSTRTRLPLALRCFGACLDREGNEVPDSRARARGLAVSRTCWIVRPGRIAQYGQQFTHSSPSKRRNTRPGRVGCLRRVTLSYTRPASHTGHRIDPWWIASPSTADIPPDGMISAIWWVKCSPSPDIRISGFTCFYPDSSSNFRINSVRLIYPIDYRRMHLPYQGS